MKKQGINFTEATTELDTIIAKLQTGDVEVDEAITLHARGSTLIKELEAYLATAENTITAMTHNKEA